MNNRNWDSPKNAFVNLSNYRSTTNYIKDKIFILVETSQFILDAGCGRWNRMFLPGKSSCWVGCDTDFQSVKDNKQINFGIVSDIQHQGFQQDTFDLIVTNDVVEHLENPKSFIRSCHKMLKKNGYLVIATPNMYSLYGILVSITPYWVKQNIFKIIFGIGCANEVYYYRLNTPNTLKTVLSANGFSKISVVLLNKLSSGSFKVRLLWFWYYYLCKIPIMRKFSPGLLCIARKT